MANSNSFDVIIIGGSYAGLSAAMALGRSRRQVLIIDSGDPCNKQTPHSHNFLTQDGKTPAEITHIATAQVLQYPSVQLHHGFATECRATDDGFAIITQAGDQFSGKKILFATGVTDIFPNIPGFADCWGISILHCPYCHGYEVRDQKIGVVGNGDMGFELCRLISNWTNNLTLFTNGKASFTPEQFQKINNHQITIIERELASIKHNQGYIDNVVFMDGRVQEVDALFARVGFTQKSAIPVALGCALTEQGFLQVDDFQRTNIPGLFAAGDNTTMFRTVSMAVAAGTKAGAVINRELIEESF